VGLRCTRPADFSSRGCAERSSSLPADRLRNSLDRLALVSSVVRFPPRVQKMGIVRHGGWSSDCSLHRENPQVLGDGNAQGCDHSTVDVRSGGVVAVL
jgi:hypothetical protein